jgi:lycopene cyclase-like protein
MTTEDGHRGTGWDLLVCGAGPAGLSLARSAARIGLKVVIAAPRPRRGWTNNFGCWADELDALPEADAIEARWTRPQVWLGEEPVEASCPYVKLSTPALQRRLLQCCEDAGVAFFDARVEDVEHHEAGSRAWLSTGATLSCRTIVDATGYDSRFVERVDQRRPGFQSAYGELVEVDGHPFEPGVMALMDYRRLSPNDDDGPATFLYAMPLTPSLIFVEETSLVGRPAMDHERLRARLGRRLHRLGIEVRRRLEREVCLIPMGTPLPRRGQRCVAFGAAASLVHPATGYQIARTLELAPAVAAAIADGLGRDPARASRQAYETIWPNHRLRAWELYTFGMNFLAGLDRPSTIAFLDAFFQLPEEEWRGFMTGRLRPAEICTSMMRVFGHAASPLKTRLIRAGTGSGKQALLRAALPSNPF